MLEVVYSIHDTGSPILSLGCYFLTVWDNPQLVANLSMINISPDFPPSYCYIILYAVGVPNILFDVYWCCGLAQGNFIII